MFTRQPRRFALTIVTVALLFAVPGPFAAHAQEDDGVEFTPTLFVLGSTTDNEFRSPGQPVGDSALYAEVELPFTFRGPRWSGGFSFNPAMRKQRELGGLNDFDTSLDGWLTGNLSRRTRVRITVGAARSAQLTGLDSADLVTSRADRVRSRVRATLDHALNAAGDSVDFGLQYDRTDYLDGEFVSEQSYGVRAGYGYAVSPRLSLSVGGGVDRFEYDGGDSAHSFSPLIGFSYRLAPRTDLRVRGGVSFIRGGTRTTDSGVRPLDGRRITAEATLSHAGEAWSLAVSGGREAASGIALGQPTLRTRLDGSLGWGNPRWRFGLSAGVARNEPLGDEGSLLLLTPDGLIATAAESVDTVSLCADAGFRLARWMSVVGSGRLVDQRPVGGDDTLRLDVYRFSFGIAVHPYAGPVKSRRGAEVLRRYGRAGSIGSC